MSPTTTIVTPGPVGGVTVAVAVAVAVAVTVAVAVAVVVAVAVTVAVGGVTVPPPPQVDTISVGWAALPAPFCSRLLIDT
jgi:hypothetical protein